MENLIANKVLWAFIRNTIIYVKETITQKDKNIYKY